MDGTTGIWSELGIEPTEDSRAIKKAYARQIAKYHPEEFPEQFQKIHEAYERALELIKIKEIPEQNVDVPEPEHGQEQEKGGKAAQISALAEKYARQAEKKAIRRRLHSHFICDIALSKMDKFVKKGKFQSHQAWENYLKDPIFPVAVHESEFILRFVRRTKDLKFWPKTMRMIREAFYQEAPEEVEQFQILRTFLDQKGPKSSRSHCLKIAAKVMLGAVAVCVLACFLFYSYRQSSEKQRKKEYRAVENIEAFISDKYQVKCTVTESALSGLYGLLLFQRDEDTNYYEVDVQGQEGMPESFRLAWDTYSMDYEDIRDSLLYETAGMCAKDTGLHLDMNFAPECVVRVDDTPVDELEQQIIEFLQALRESKAVQAGQEIVIKIQPGFLYSEAVAVFVKKDKEIDQEEVKAKLAECMEGISYISGD